MPGYSESQLRSHFHKTNLGKNSAIWVRNIYHHFISTFLFPFMIALSFLIALTLTTSKQSAVEMLTF